MMDYVITANPPARRLVSFEKAIYEGALIITGLSIAYLLSVFIAGFAWLPLAGMGADSSELTLSLIQCVLGALSLHIPKLIEKLTNVKLPDALCALFYIFVICGTVLGEMLSLYYTIPVWDSLLHFSSGIMAGILGGILLVNFLANKKCSCLISPMFIAIATVCFALCIGVFWEIYEFTGDNLFGLNMQKCLLQDGSGLVGQTALLDTMKDLIVDAAGAIVAAAASFVSLKRKAGWLHAYRMDEIKTVQQGIFRERQVLPYSA